MKLNSNTVLLKKEHFEEIENIIKKIASDTDIGNVESVSILMDPTQGMIKFKIAEEEEEETELEMFIPQEEVEKRQKVKTESSDEPIEIKD